MGTGAETVYCTHMNKTLLSSPQTLQDLQDFMFDTMASSEMAVDWFCDRFNVNADDDVIEYKEEWEKDDKFDVEKHINGDIEF